MNKEDIKNEIQSFIVYYVSKHYGCNDIDNEDYEFIPDDYNIELDELTCLLTCLDEYIDNDHIINE